ncbi:MAG: Xaa-Pro peptidase family protein [Pseudomonadota bacterium]|nr:Xaa-Pro peptidase family protein [Pseudomonadota bacterium]
MTIGVGGSYPTAELQAMQSMRGDAHPISNTERETRIAKAQELMRQQGITALYLDASTSLYYYTGLRAGGKERLHGAAIPADGPLSYICPAFEVEKTAASIVMPGEIRGWEEHEDPTALVIDTVEAHGAGGTLAVDESTPFFTFDGLRKAGNRFDFVNGSDITGACRMIKSETEIALMKRAKEITLEVQKAAARILTPGITTEEVKAFIAEAHRKLGADGPTAFCIVLFGEATAYPHGVPHGQTLNEGDMVLIDTGTTVEGYHSDITRSYVFGEATPRQREIWNLELAAQAAAFNAAQPGAPCEDVDAAARAVIEKGGLGPGYAVPGLPHRTGHGIGLDVHEWTYLVKENRTPLAPGMCFSNEPMICIYGEFGVRLEDHFYITEDGSVWFTQPCHSVDDPFGYEATP